MCRAVDLHRTFFLISTKRDPNPPNFPSVRDGRRLTAGTDPLPKDVPQLGDGSFDLGDQRSIDADTSPRQGGVSDPLVLEAPTARPGWNDPIRIDTLTFADDGIGVTRSRG